MAGNAQALTDKEVLSSALHTDQSQVFPLAINWLFLITYLFLWLIYLGKFEMWKDFSDCIKLFTE